MKSGKKVAYTAELLAWAVSPAWFVLVEGELHFCDWNDNGAMATPGR